MEVIMMIKMVTRVVMMVTMIVTHGSDYAASLFRPRRPDVLPSAGLQSELLHPRPRPRCWIASALDVFHNEGKIQPFSRVFRPKQYKKQPFSKDGSRAQKSTVMETQNSKRFEETIFPEIYKRILL